MVARATHTTGPRWTTSSPRARNTVALPAGDRDGCVLEVEQAGPATFGPLECRPQEVPEERGGPVGTALELGMGLRADPVGVAVELDELHQAAVGGVPVRAQPRRLEPAPVRGVDLVAVAVALRHHPLAVGLGHLGPALE